MEDSPIDGRSSTPVRRHLIPEWIQDRSRYGMAHEHLSPEPSVVAARSAQLAKDMKGKTAKQLVDMLPKIPDYRRLVRQEMLVNDSPDVWWRSTDEPWKTNELTELSYVVGDTLQILFELCGITYLWEYVLHGELTICGSILLYILGHFPRRDSLYALKHSDINLFTEGALSPLDLESCGYSKTQPTRSRPGWMNQQYKVDIAADHEFSQNLPARVTVNLQNFLWSGNRGMLGFASNRFTCGKLMISTPGQFVARVAEVTVIDPPTYSIAQKYRGRGYALAPSSMTRYVPRKGESISQVPDLFETTSFDRWEFNRVDGLTYRRIEPSGSPNHFVCPLRAILTHGVECLESTFISMLVAKMALTSRSKECTDETK